MNISLNRIFGLVSLAGLAGASLSHATTHATFHLPVTAHWGQAVLTPGDYKIEMGETPSGLRQFDITSAKQHLRSWPITTDRKEQDGSSSLQLVEWQGAYFVREYRCGGVGKTYIFGLPKHLAGHETKVVEIRD